MYKLEKNDYRHVLLEKTPKHAIKSPKITYSLLVPRYQEILNVVETLLPCDIMGGWVNSYPTLELQQQETYGAARKRKKDTYVEILSGGWRE